MSGFDNVITGKLKLKGKALDVKSGGLKKKKKQKKQYEQISKTIEGESGEVFIPESLEDEVHTDTHQETEDGSSTLVDDTLTPAERRYMEQRERIDRQKLKKTSDKSHRDRIEDFNQYLANMSEHYDIPKVGPG